MDRINISDIKVDERARRDVGNLDELVASIEQVGLLHPVVLTPDRTLVAGFRRIEAFKKMGQKKIPCVIVDCLDDLLARLTAERDENTCRKDFTPSESVAAGAQIEEVERQLAQERMKATQAKKGDGRVGCDKLSQPEKRGKTRDKVGRAVGMSGATYERAKAVVASGDSEAIAEMDRTGKVTPAYEKVKGHPTDYKGNRHNGQTTKISKSDKLKRAHKARRPRICQLIDEVQEMVSQPFTQVPVIQLRQLVKGLRNLIYKEMSE